MRLPTILPTLIRSTSQHQSQAVSPALSASASALRHYSATPPSKPAHPTRRPILGRYQVTPIELFRTNSGKNVILRDYTVQRAHGRASFDLHLGPDGLVHPKPGPNYEGPNGASLRPLGPMLQEIVRTFRGRDTTIYRLPEGLELPKELILLHEHSDHYSIQTTEPVRLRDLNDRITDFVKRFGEPMTKMEWCDRYPF